MLDGPSVAGFDVLHPLYYYPKRAALRAGYFDSGLGKPGMQGVGGLSLFCKRFSPVLGMPVVSMGVDLNGIRTEALR